MSKEYNSALQARVEQFLKEKNISQAKAAPLMGISQTALSQYRRSMYDNGDIAALESKLEEFFRTQEEQEVNTDLIYKTQKELRSFAVYSDADVEAFAKEYFRSTKQDKNAVGRMSSVLKPVADRYNQKTQAERYQFRRLLRSLVKWYGYISQVARMFDEELHKENLFCAYLLKLLPPDEVSPLDLEGKLQLESVSYTHLRAHET